MPTRGTPRPDGEQIDAVYQMDMIGYNVVPPATFELHAGYLASPTVQASSIVLAERIVRLAPIVAPGLGTAQVYRSNSSTDRDPAEGRSDHAAFHQRGYPAVAATEDFFVGPGPAAVGAEPELPPGDGHFRRWRVRGRHRPGRGRRGLGHRGSNSGPRAQGGTMAIKLGSGATTEGATDWQPYSGVGVYVDVNTTAGGFTNTPKYFTAIGGSSSHWATTGATSIYSPDPDRLPRVCALVERHRTDPGDSQRQRVAHRMARYRGLASCFRPRADLVVRHGV